MQRPKQNEYESEWERPESKKEKLKLLLKKKTNPARGEDDTGPT